MKFAHELINLIGSVFEFFIIIDFLRNVSGKKKQQKLTFALSLVAYLLVSLFMDIGIRDQALNFVIKSAVLISVSFLYDISTPKRLVYSALLIALMLLAEIFSGLLLTVFVKESVKIHSENIITYMLGVLCSKLLAFTILQPIKYYASYSEAKMSKKMFLSLMLLPCSSFLVIWSVSKLVYSTNERLPLFLFTFAISALIAANMAVFYLYESYLQQLDQQMKLEMVYKQISYQASHFQDLAEMRQRSNKTLHDIKNGLFSISKAVKEDPIKAAALIDDLCIKASGGERFATTGNDAFDALLSVKNRQMELDKTKFKFHFFLPSQNSIDDIDLCVLLGNLLDNAIEACKKIKRTENRNIDLTVSQNGS